MPPSCRLAIVALVASAAVGALQGQQPNTEFKITKVEDSFQESPDFSGNKYGTSKRVRNAGQWLEVETTFDWVPRQADPKYLDEIVMNYYILLKNADRENPKGTLLTGSVTHVDVKQSKGLLSVVYVAPRTLERLFAGKLPVNVGQTVAGIGVTITKDGEVVAEDTGSGRGQWWTDPEMKAVEGKLLNKSETPFAHMVWDYHEPVKTKAGGK